VNQFKEFRLLDIQHTAIDSIVALPIIIVELKESSNILLVMPPFRDEFDGNDESSLPDDDDDESGRSYGHNNNDGARESQRTSHQDRNRANNNHRSSSNENNIHNTNTHRNNDGGKAVPRRWLYDRVDGTSRIEGIPLRRQQPPCFLCFPPPILKVCPWLLEENSICRTLGRVGCCNESGGLRSNALKFALWLNTCSFLVTVVAALALTDDEYDILSLFSFSKADLEPTQVDGVESIVDYPIINLRLGLQALGVNNPNSAGVGASSSTMTAGAVIPFDEFCTSQGTDQLMSLQNCDACSEASLYLLVGMLVTLVAQLPTFATDYLRLYTNYDVNCQKVSATLWGIVCLAGYGVVYYYFHYVCAASFYTGQIQYTVNGTLVETLVDPTSGIGIVVVDFDWKVGPGQICLLVGFGLKALQMVCNCCVSTPTITRNRTEQWKYETKSSHTATADEEDGLNADNIDGNKDDSESESS
jgi:hypothetical protein